MTIIVAAAEVLKCFSAERQELNLTDIVAMRGAPKSSTSRLLRAMRDAGLPRKRRLEQAVPSQSPAVPARPALSVRLVADGAGGGGRVRPRGAGRPHRLHLHSRGRRCVRACATFAGRHVLRVGTPVGRKLHRCLRRPPDDRCWRACLTIRSGTMFAGGWPIPSATRPAEHGRADRPHPRGPPRPACRESNDESNRGVGALATAVGDPQTGETISLCVTYPAATITPDERAIIVDGLLAGARSIATVLGDKQCHSLRPVPHGSQRK